MKKSPSKKGVERRKKPRGRAGAKAKAQPAPVVSRDICRHCSNKIGQEGRALFVEEEVGRIFCSEECISAYFAPEVQRLEKEYFKVVSDDDDLTSKEREQFGHLRWITLQEPDEIWREKTLGGDYRYTLMSQFQPGSRRIWSVCVCLFLRGEPSFLYLAFATRSAAVLDYYRRGERMQRMQVPEHAAEAAAGGDEGAMDRLAPAWTNDETIRARLSQERRSDDISPSEYPDYVKHLEPTLETPDEVWRTRLGGADQVSIFQFIRRFEVEGRGFWYIVVAKETDSEDELEVLDAFPTVDSHMVDSFRRGEQHVGATEPPASSRTVH